MIPWDSCKYSCLRSLLVAAGRLGSSAYKCNSVPFSQVGFASLEASLDSMTLFYSKSWGSSLTQSMV